MNQDNPNSRRSFLKGAVATPLAIAGASVLMPARAAHDDSEATAVAPSTTTEPYLLPTITGAKTVAILPRISWEQAGSCWTSRRTRRAPTLSWWKAASCSHCS